MGKLENYLLTHRKRSGLSQKEIAYLLGCGDGTKVSRYEHNRRRPSLAAALACEAVFGVPVSELFAGLYEKVENKATRRARELEARLKNGDGSDRATARKLAVLASVIAPDEKP